MCKIAGVFQYKEMLSFSKCPGPNDTICFFQNTMYKILTSILSSITSHENGLNMQTQEDFAFTERHFTAHEWRLFLRDQAGVFFATSSIGKRAGMAGCR